jgi:hypothetical protein
VRSGSGASLYTYRSFSSILGVVATLTSAIVVLAGIAASVFLLAEKQPLPAAAAVVLTAVFTWFIAMLVPATTVTLFDSAGSPLLTISQTRRARWSVTDTDGGPVAEVRRHFLSRLGRHHWLVTRDGRYLAEAREAGLFRAWRRKAAGKFSRRFETDLLIFSGPIPAGRIVRRNENGRTDFVELDGTVLDWRAALALATLVLGSEP